MLEAVPDTNNVSYIDEYPELKARVMRRRGQQALFSADLGQLVLFPVEGEGDGEFSC